MARMVGLEPTSELALAALTVRSVTDSGHILLVLQKKWCLSLAARCARLDPGTCESL
jgi:hypothetical protein